MLNYLSLSLLFLALTQSLAFANLQVFPLRADLTQRERTTSLTVRNRGDKTTTYQISSVFYQQDYEGQMSLNNSPPATERSVKDFLRFSPRRVTLAPGESQVVRLMIRPGADLAAGDYRAHIRFEPMDSEGKTEPNLVMRMQLEAKVAVNIPVIYRHGQVEGDVSLEKFSIQKDQKGELSFSVVMKKTGNIFATGVFMIYHQKDLKKAQAIVRGVSSYRDERRFIFPLEDFSLKKGKYILKFLADEFDESSLAEVEFEWKG